MSLLAIPASAVVFVLCCPTAAVALDRDEPQARRAQPQTPSAPSAPRFKEFHRALGWNLTRGLFSADNVVPLLIGSGGSLAAHAIDDEVTDEFRGSFDALGETGNIIGNPGTIAVSVGALLLTTPFTESPRFRAFTFSLAQAQIVESVLKYGLKAAVSRTRPNGENDNAFPSGHASGTFTFATVAGHYYGKKVGIPAYAVAVLVGASRIEHGKHFLSDVVFGAMLGYIAGRTAIRGTERAAGDTRVAVVPTLGFRHAGVSCSLQF